MCSGVFVGDMFGNKLDVFWKEGSKEGKEEGGFFLMNDGCWFKFMNF